MLNGVFKRHFYFSSIEVIYDIWRIKDDRSERSGTETVKAPYGTPSFMASCRIISESKLYDLVAYCGSALTSRIRPKSRRFCGGKIVCMLDSKVIWTLTQSETWKGCPTVCAVDGSSICIAWSLQQSKRSKFSHKMTIVNIHTGKVSGQLDLTDHFSNLCGVQLVSDRIAICGLLHQFGTDIRVFDVKSGRETLRLSDNLDEGDFVLDQYLLTETKLVAQVLSKSCNQGQISQTVVIDYW